MGHRVSGNRKKWRRAEVKSKEEAESWCNRRVYKGGGHTTRLSARIKIKETTDAIEVTRVSDLSVP